MINITAKVGIVLLITASSFSAFAAEKAATDARQKQIEMAAQLLELSGLTAHAEALPDLAEATLEQAAADMPRNSRKKIRNALRETFVAEYFQSELLAALVAAYDSEKVPALIARYRSSSVQDVIEAAQKALDTDRSSRAVWQSTMGEATSTSEKRALIEQVVDNGFQKPVNQVMRRTLASSLIHARASLSTGINTELHQDQLDAEQHHYEFTQFGGDDDVELKRAIHGFRSVSASQLRAYLLSTRGENSIWLNQLAAQALSDALLDSVRKMQLLIEQNQQSQLQRNAYSWP